MLEIYKPVPILKKLPLTLECMTAFGDCLIVASNQGYLFKYRVCPKRNFFTNYEFDVQLLESYKKFPKKSILQIEAVPELKILIVLSDNMIHVCSLNDLDRTIQTIQKTKAASHFVIDLQKQRTLTGEDQPMLRMCVVVRRKLMLFYWKNDNFHELSADIPVQDQPKIVTWCGESLCIGYKTEYCFIDLADVDNSKELSPTGGKQAEPIMRLLEGKRLAIGRDQQTYILDDKGNPMLKYPICWSDIPLNIIDDNPYLIAALPSSIIEIRTIEPRLFIQRIELAQEVTNYNKIRFIIKFAGKRGHIVVASTTDIFAIVAVPIDQQISQMLSDKQFELALQLANMDEVSNQGSSSDSSDSKGRIEDDPSASSVSVLSMQRRDNSFDSYIDLQSDKTIQEIETLHAFDLFCKKRFEEAMKLFLKLDIDPSRVIGLFPELLPDKFPSLPYPNKLPELSGGDLEKGLSALIDYLVEVRSRILSPYVNSNQSSGIQRLQGTFVDERHMDGTTQGSNRSQKSIFFLRQIVDTTLLKCYLQTNEALVASLLRLPDNNCNLDETERALMKFHRYNELIILYQNKGLHRKALDLIVEQSIRSDSPLLGQERLIEYLQHLGPEKFDIITQYAKQVLESSPEEGLKIFTADLPEVEQLDRALVLDYLQECAPSVVISYLEHIIYTWKDESPEFHDHLIHKYREKVAPLLAEYQDFLPPSQQACTAGSEPGELGVYRSRLLHFLEVSEHYECENLPVYLLNEGLFAERAVVVGKRGDHKEALSLYLHFLSDPRKAEEYCASVHEKKLPRSQNIFFILLKLYLHPPESFLKPPDIESAIRLLKEHADKIDPIAAIKELPTDLDVYLIKDYIIRISRKIMCDRHHKEMFKNLVMSKYYQVQKSWIELQRANKIVIDEQTTCRACNKRLGKSAFVRFPNSDLVHYSCRELYSRTQRVPHASEMID